MRISNASSLSLVFNLSCAFGNAYQAPGTFSLGFALGIIIGLGMGLKHRISLITLELNERAVKQIGEKAQPVQDILPSIKEKVNNSYVGNFLERHSGLIQLIFRSFLYLTGYHAIYDTTASYLGNFDEQRAHIIKKLNPIPGIISSLLSFGALMANIGYIENFWAAKVALLSGLPAGYAAGTFLMRNYDWKILGNQSYSIALANSDY